MRLLHSRFSENPTTKQVVSKYQSLSKREQILLCAMSLLLVTYAFYAIVWQPIKTAEQTAKTRLDAAYQTHQLLIENAELIASTQGKQGDSLEDRSAQELQSLVTRTMRQHKLIAQRLNLEGDSRLQVWVENTAYADITKLLEVLAKNNVTIYSVQFVSRDIGMVDMRLTLD